MKILFVTWDGPQVSYLEGLFLPIFRRLADEGFVFHVLQFTWGNKQKISRARTACESSSIPYRSVRVWRRPVSAGSLLTALYGPRAIRRTIREWGIDVVMPRSTLPALSTLLALRGRSLPMVFDADGLPIDERVDFDGRSPSGLVYRFLRDIEAQASRRADVVLTRSSRGGQILHARAGAGTAPERFYVVGNGRDGDPFNPQEESYRESVRENLGLPRNAPLLAYAGSMGEQYCVPEMLGLFERVLSRRPDARLLLLTGSPEAVPPALSSFPHLKEAVTTLSLPPDQVPGYLAAADLGLALRSPKFSMQAVAPIKVGEYLLCGLPVVATSGIGDTDTLSGDVRYLLEDMSSRELDEAADWFVDMVLPHREVFRDRCRHAGEASFSLEASVASYLAAFTSLPGGEDLAGVAERPVLDG
ncbi:hypothetical protein AN478_10535 [Thiohalorhabdus denitrificans]|uniref:Glycosyltransferase involved in cell wall bisynthesis n=1 Tax=Thiohalorhabdus denitrificans TaxID=381306 RepID=A0A0P9C8R4_9GAMM|nr:glycosyltransferase family 4 protein [Thiohalorhabdus denitrificans]KPV39570.1 hypothetical protein AN478_10535 [Thiohalorhabdus denitrificans]SCX98285.1 Glycosyltransferase involved in cell wall bisynthesis [Thiohalorhabdus denitrificans]